MAEKIIDEHLNDKNHIDSIEQNLDQAIKEQGQMKKLVDLFMLALVLIFAMYSIF